MDFSFPAIVGLITALFGGAPAAIDSTPRSLLEAIYNPPAAAGRSLSADDIYSDRLQTLFLNHEIDRQVTLASTKSESPPIELVPFDPLTLGGHPRNVAISDPVIRDRQATASVSFDGPKGPVQLSVFLIDEAGGWRIDDVASFDAGGEPWLLSWLLRYDPVSAD